MADSTCKAEYITASDAAKKVVWLQKFINELGVAPSLDGPILLYCDSTSAIAQAKESKSHQQTKHILCCYHLVWKIVDRGDVELQKIDEKENLIDPFTRPSMSKSSSTINQRWVYDTISIGFSPSGSC